MANLKNNRRALIEGRAVLVVIDIQADAFLPVEPGSPIEGMPGYSDRMLLARRAIDAARDAGVAVIFV